MNCFETMFQMEPYVFCDENLSDYEKTIYALTAAIDTKDHYTFDHSNNVAYYAVELAYAFGMNKETAEIIREAALLHDVGKMKIATEISVSHPKKMLGLSFQLFFRLLNRCYSLACYQFKKIITLVHTINYE